MNANLTFATGGFLDRTKFILVNDRVPRGSIIKKASVIHRRV